ncbi:MAG: penicillin-binding protein [Flavobacteriaceae bacterium]|nr:penicillin-binding protein [Flavobacteriaceae bacterium]|tara:strand:+ start:375 stop:2363 length:1989 start_codon:yes stop_codon:yes gene_type:complete
MIDELLKKIMNRFYFVIFFMIIFSFVLMGKLIYIQVVDGEKYKIIASNQTVKNVVLQPSRGNIYSEYGSLMATSVAQYEVRWDSKVPSNSLYNNNKEKLAKDLSLILQTPYTKLYESLENARENNNRYMLIAKNLSYSKLKKIRSLPIFNLPSFKGGLIVEQQIKREHPLGKIAERTIGYEQKSLNGNYFRVGIEGAFGTYLRGEEGRRLKQRIANGQWKPINDVNEKEPTQGHDVYTTINLNIQDITHSALLEQLEKYKAEHGTAVVMETKTGKIRAIVNLGRTSKGTYYEKLNYAVGELNEPGSTFKLISMIAALEDKAIDLEDLVDTGNGEITFYNKYKVRDVKKGGYGLIPASKVFELSSNVGMVNIVHNYYKDDPSKFVNRLYNMGVNKPLGVSIKGEPKPKIPYPSDKDWDGLDLPWMAYGYGLSMTPLQILSFYNAIANDGELLRPQFIEKITNAGEKPQKVFKKEIINPSICSEETLIKIKSMLFNVVDKKWGTANQIKDSLFNVAGKTGTCQLDYTKEEVQYISSFVGYFPAENPTYSCIVVIHRPDKSLGYYGSTVAAPVFKKIAKKIYISTPKNIIIKPSEIRLSLNKAQNDKINNIEIPDLVGKTSLDAISIVEKLGLNFKIVGNGRVVKQSIKPGTKIKVGQLIVLEFS